jgi:hypothetical protein
MISGFSIRRLNAPLVGLVLTVWSSFSAVHAVEGAGKVGVVSFGLFGVQGVFKSEATSGKRT